MSQTLPVNCYATMTVTGQGHVMANPDLAVIRFGVQTTGTNVAQIQAENAQITQRVIQTLQQLGISDIKTVQYTIDKAYEYENGKQIDKGYIVQNILEIRTNAMNQIGTIIDIAVKMGANIVNSVSFTLSDPDRYYQQSLNLAVDNAIQKSKTISANLHTRLNPIPIRIIENNVSPVPMPLFQREAAATPILPGELRVEAQITADFQYADTTH